jgi:CheY-like chemotaxis protein
MWGSFSLEDSMKVLYIEDDVDIRSSVARFLRHVVKAIVTTVGTGEGAVKVLEAGRDSFDIIISDWSLSENGITGGDVLAWLRMNSPAMARKFIFVSANAAAKIVANENRVPYLDKPIDVEQLANVIKTLSIAA